jgi:hypothetical protein
MRVMYNIQCSSHPQTYILLVSYQYKTKLKEIRCKVHYFLFRDNTIAFSICNKPFKPLGLPGGRVKSRESLPENVMHKHYANHVIHKIEVSQKQCFLFISKLNKTHSIFKTIKSSQSLNIYH